MSEWGTTTRVRAVVTLANGDVTTLSGPEVRNQREKRRTLVADNSFSRALPSQALLGREDEVHGASGENDRHQEKNHANALVLHGTSAPSCRAGVFCSA